MLRRISGRLTLVGFVEIEFSDFDTGAPQGAPCPHLPPGMWSGRPWIGAIEAQFTAPEPGPIDIVFFAIIGGFNGNRNQEPRHATAVVVE